MTAVYNRQQGWAHLQLESGQLGFSSLCDGCLSISSSNLLCLQLCICLFFPSLISSSHLLHTINVSGHDCDSPAYISNTLYTGQIVTESPAGYHFKCHCPKSECDTSLHAHTHTVNENATNQSLLVVCVQGSTTILRTYGYQPGSAWTRYVPLQWQLEMEAKRVSREHKWQSMLWHNQGTCSMRSCQQEHSPTRETISVHCKAHKLQCQSHAQVTFITRAIRDSSCLSASCLLKAPTFSAVLCRICLISTSYSPAASCKLQLSSAPFVFRCLMTCRELQCCNQGMYAMAFILC